MSPAPTTPAALGDLFTQYLLRQAEAQAEGLGFAELPGDAELHDAVPVQPVDPRPAWTDAQLAARLGGVAAAAGAAAPPDWPLLVATREPAQGLAFALGNFPQMVRDLQPLLRGEARLPTGEVNPTPSEELLAWAEKQRGPGVLLAAGVLRVAGHFDRAGALLAGPAEPAWEAAVANERAALAWHRGDAEGALAQWLALPDGVPAHFNRGMASLFLGRREEARRELQAASRALPETSAWHHLAQLYLALAG